MFRKLRGSLLWSILINALVTTTAQAAPTGLALSWDESANQETVYRVNLDTGEETPYGSINNLKGAVVGSHSSDFATGAFTLLGIEGDNEDLALYLGVPDKRIYVKFSVDGLSSSNEPQSTNISPDG